MTEAFWWYLLAGFLVGFTLSTLWEWLYFRRKRMRIENRRIAELEAMLRSYSVSTENQTAAAGPRETWVAPPFDDPGAYLDIEDEAAVSAAPRADNPPMTYQPVRTAQINGERGTPVSAAPPPSTLPSNPPQSGAQAAVAGATVATARAVAADREEPPAQSTAAPPQAYASTRSSAFPTAAAQASSTATPAGHAIPKGVASHDTVTEPSPPAFPSAAAQPVTTRAPLAIVPAAARNEPAPAPSAPEPVTLAEETDRSTATTLAAAGTIAAVAAAQQAMPEAEEPAEDEAEEEPAIVEPPSDDLAESNLPTSDGTRTTVLPANIPDQPDGDPDRAPAAATAAVTADEQQEASPASSTGEPKRDPGTVAAATTAAVIAKELSDENRANNAEQPYANGHYDGAVPGAASTPASRMATSDVATAGAPPASDSQAEPITPAKIDALVASIHELIDAVNQERAEDAVEATALVAAAGQLQETVVAGPAAAARGTRAAITPEAVRDVESTNRVEEALVLLVRSISRFFRQLRVILSGEGTQAPQLQRSAAGAELMHIDGIQQQHIDRLRVAGITSPAHLARLSEDELRMLLISPGNEPAPDYSAWLVRAAEITAGETGARP